MYKDKEQESYLKCKKKSIKAIRRVTSWIVTVANQIRLH